MRAIGCVRSYARLRRYTIASSPGWPDALQAQTTQIVGMQSLGFDLSANIVVMLILCGAGRLYGRRRRDPIYLIAQDVLAKGDPGNWYLWLAWSCWRILMFARGGVLGFGLRHQPSLQGGGVNSGPILEHAHQQVLRCAAVISDLDFALARGERCALIGPTAPARRPSST